MMKVANSVRVPALQGNGTTGYGGRWKIFQVTLPLYTSSFSVRFIFRSGNPGVVYDGAAIDLVQFFQVLSAPTTPCPQNEIPRDGAVVSMRDFNVEGKIGVKFSWSLPPTFFNLTAGYEQGTFSIPYYLLLLLGYYLLLGSEIYYVGFDTEYVAFLDPSSVAWNVQSSIPCVIHNIIIQQDIKISDFPYEENFEEGMGMWLIQSENFDEISYSLRCWKIFNLDSRISI